MAQQFKIVDANTILEWQWQQLRDDPLWVIRSDNSIRILFSRALVKVLLGGKWPQFHGFNFDAIAWWELEEDSTLLPLVGDPDVDAKDSSNEELAPGPSFQLSISMIDDVFQHPPKVIRLKRPKAA